MRVGVSSGSDYGGNKVATTTSSVKLANGNQIADMNAGLQAGALTGITLSVSDGWAVNHEGWRLVA